MTGGFFCVVIPLKSLEFTGSCIWMTCKVKRDTNFGLGACLLALNAAGIKIALYTRSTWKVSSLESRYLVSSIWELLASLV